MTVTAADDARLAPARAAFEHWATNQPGHPGDVASLIERLESTDAYAGLLSTDIQGRRVVWKSVPYSGKARVTFPAVSIETIDAWSVDDAQQLRASSEHIASCDTCGGNGKITCSHCSGGKITCGECGGQRKMYGYAANGSYRLLNCQGCRGKGEIDCAHCRRGIAVCSTCAGERRVQRWIELEWWRRAVTNVRPEQIAQRFDWSANPQNAEVERDALLVSDTEKPYRLTAKDIGAIPPDWLTQLAPQLQPGERVARQRLRVVRIPSYTVHYRVGSDADRVTFEGRRFIAPGGRAVTAFTRRTARLRTLRNVLFVVALTAMLFALARGMFYWSTPTFASLIAFSAALGAIYGAATDWTAARKYATYWLSSAAVLVTLAIAFTYVALPDAAHASQLVAAGKLDEAEREIAALGDDTPRDVRDALTIARALERARDTALDEAASLLATVNSGTPVSPAQIAAANAIYVPLAQQRIGRQDWNGAADAVANARRHGVAAAAIDPLCDAIHAAATRTAAEARDEIVARNRLRTRLAAEETLMAWEKATGKWGTPELIALRTLMARDLAAVEKRSRR